MIRTAWVTVNILIGTVLLGLTVIIASLLRVKGQLYEGVTRNWSRWLLWASGTTIVPHGLERIRIDRPQIFVSNHESWYDVFTIASVLPKRSRFVAKKELGSIPIFGQAWKAAGHVSVDRGDRNSAIQSLEAAGNLLKSDNSSVVIFPEGTRSPDGNLLPFKKGAFRLALASGVDLVPVGVVGGRDVMPKGAWQIRKGTVIVRFGDPIRVEDWCDKPIEQLMSHTRDRIQALRSR